MKRNTILIIILIILAGAAAYLIYTNREGSYSKELSDFAVEDTASVDKIFLADKQGNNITLIRKSPGMWMVNDQFHARQESVVLLLSCIKNIEVRSPVGKRAYENVIKRLSSQSVKCEIYQKGDLEKIIYVGGGTQDHLGTYMYLENSSVPFITHIPGFTGYLTPRFFTTLNDWKDKSVFLFPPSEVKSISITDKENPPGNFRIQMNNSTKRFELQNLLTNEKAALNDDILNQFMNFYSRTSYEGIETNMPRERYDSLLTIGWFRKIEVESKDGKKQTVELYRKKQGRETLDVFGNDPKLSIDADRFFARIDNDTIMVLAQYQLFNKLFRNVDSFSK